MAPIGNFLSRQRIFWLDGECIEMRRKRLEQCRNVHLGSLEAYEAQKEIIGDQISRKQEYKSGGRQFRAGKMEKDRDGNKNS